MSGGWHCRLRGSSYCPSTIVFHVSDFLPWAFMKSFRTVSPQASICLATADIAFLCLCLILNKCILAMIALAMSHNSVNDSSGNIALPCCSCIGSTHHSFLKIFVLCSELVYWHCHPATQQWKWVWRSLWGCAMDKTWFDCLLGPSLGSV